MKFKRNLALTSILLAIAAYPQVVLAHRILADTQVYEDGVVQVEAFFPDGTPARGAKVEVFRPDGSVFSTGKTDVDGKLSVDTKGQSGTWRTVVTGSMGHRAETEFEIAGGSEAPVRGAGARGRPERSLDKRRKSQKERIPWFKVISGLGFICAVTSFIMVIRLRAELKRTKNASAGD